MDFVVSDIAAPGVVLRLDEQSRLPACAAGLGSKRVLEAGIAHGRGLVYDLASDAIVYDVPDPVTLCSLLGERTFKVTGLEVVNNTLMPGVAVIDGVKVEVRNALPLEDYLHPYLTAGGVNYAYIGLDLIQGYTAEALFKFAHLFSRAPRGGNGKNILVGSDVEINEAIKSDHVVIFASGTCTINAPIDVSASCLGDGLYGGAGSMPSAGSSFASIGAAPVSYGKLGELGIIIAEMGTSPSANSVDCYGIAGLTDRYVGQGASGAKVADAEGNTWQAKAGGSVLIIAKKIVLNAPIKAGGEPGKEFSSIENKAYGVAGGGGGGVVLLRALNFEIGAEIDVSGYGAGWWRADKL
jgi:hypothetical protein